MTLLLYQPATLGLLVAAALMVGAVASRWMVTLSLLLPAALVAEQVKVMPLVSLVIFCVSQPLWLLMAAPLATTVQETVTLLTYQPLLPSVPTILGVMVGGLLTTVRVTLLSVLVLARLP